MNRRKFFSVIGAGAAVAAVPALAAPVRVVCMVPELGMGYVGIGPFMTATECLRRYEDKMEEFARMDIFEAFWRDIAGRIK